MKNSYLSVLLVLVLITASLICPYHAMAESVQTMTADELEAYMAYLEIVLQNKRKEEDSGMPAAVPQPVRSSADETIEVIFNGSTYSGSYQGDSENGKPHGSGVFEGYCRGSKLTYNGLWANGGMTGTGTVEADTYILHFDETDGATDCTGSYAGDVVNGLPEGKGTFVTASWKYDGEWKNGMFNGQGIQTWENGSTKKEGTFNNNEFMPTAAEAFVYTAREKEYKISSKGKTALKKYKNYFNRKQINGIPKETHIDSKFDLKQYKKSPNDYGDKLVYVSNAKVFQVFTWEIGGKTVEQILMETKNNDIYYGFYYGKSNIVEDMKISAYVLPFDWKTYKNVSGDDVWAVFCAITDYMGEPNAIMAPAVSDLSKATVGSTILYGNIRWKVLAAEKSKVLVISEEILTYRAYHSKAKHVTWADSDLRKWLNGEFLKSTFSEQEQKSIVEVKNNNSGKDPYGVKARNGKTTKDKLFVLKYEEAKKYYDAIVTQYGVWWTRTPDNFGANYLFSGSEWKNEEYIGTDVDNKSIGVRPAMWIAF